MNRFVLNQRLLRIPSIFICTLLGVYGPLPGQCPAGSNLSSDSIDQLHLIYTWNRTDAQLSIPTGICLNNALIRDRIDMSNVEFIKPIHITNSRFLSTSIFYHGKNFSQSGQGIGFDAEASFDNDTFVNLLDIRSSQFGNNCSYQYCQFNRRADFTYAYFEDTAYFNNSIFSDSAHFMSVTFRKFVDFSNAQFTSVAYFAGLNLENETNFSFTSAKLPHILDFSDNPIILRDIEFTDADFSNQDGPCLVYLNRTDISKLHLDYTHFRLLFNNPEFASNPELSNDEKESIYEELLNNFKLRGQNESYEELDIEYQNFKWASLPWYGGIFGVFPKWWWCYGYKRGWVFLWTVIFLMIFTFINYFRLNYLNEKVYHMQNIEEFPSLGSNEYTGRMRRRRWWNSFIYTSNIFFRLTLKMEELKFNSYRWVLYVLLIYGIGLVCIAYMANYVLQK